MLISVVLLAVFSICHSAGWSYSGPNGPANWYRNYSLCGDQSQSPVDIIHGSVVNNDMGALKFSNYHWISGYRMKLKNNGHTAQVDLVGPKSVLPSITGGGLSDTFLAAQFHFHWGSVDTQGSEHTLNGNLFPLELHIVHYNDKYKSLTQAANKSDGLAVFALFFKVGSAHSGLTQVTNKLSSVVTAGTSVTLRPFKLDSLFGRITRETFYRYRGSLTTPPCYESVTWTVFTETQTLSPQQMEYFRSLKEASGSYLVDNFRPTQPLNGRLIYTDFYKLIIHRGCRIC